VIELTNSLSGKKEPFEPIEPGKVRIYVCGPTVYNFIHIGNARPLIFFDVVVRYLKFCGYQVTHVMNYTDVDDKIIKKAEEENKTTEEITQKYIEEFQTDMKLLKVHFPNIQPKVTDHITEIIDLVKTLIERKVAYVVDDGEVFFSVRAFPEYGKLSKKNIDDLISGARVATDLKKRDPLDFSLWKPRKKPDEPAWSSPWGMGRPGWHIECSAMAMKYLSESFDIHGGGMDLMHPHHENEIAQSEGATSKPFSKYWMHNNMLTIQSEKMSKSLGNIWLTRDFIEKYTAEALKFFLLSGHYRSTLDFSVSQIRDLQSALHRIYKTLEKAHQLAGSSFSEEVTLNSEGKAVQEFSSSFEKNWKSAMDDDFNTAKVFALVFDYVRLVNGFVDKKGFQLNKKAHELLTVFIQQISTLSQVINLFTEDPTTYLNEVRRLFLSETGLSEEKVKQLIQERIQARQQKNFGVADQIRKDLLSKGIELMDKVDRTEWDVMFTESQTTTGRA